MVEVVLVPLESANNKNQGLTSLRNAKLIGGLVGLIGGVIVIGVCIAGFMFLRKRKNKVANQLPNFHDDSSLEEKGFKKLFSNPNDSETAAGFSEPVAAGGYGVAGFSRNPSTSGGYHATYSDDPSKRDEDYVYRGVASQNLDLVFGGPSKSGLALRGSKGYQLEDHHSTTDDDFDFNDYDDDLIVASPRQQHSVFGNLNGSNSQSRFHEEI